MKIIHLNCISTCPLGGRLMDGRSASLFERGELACHCLLLELDNTLVLVDTGLGLADVANPSSRLSYFFLALLSPDFRAEMTAARQIEMLGYDRKDVGHIILTHLDFDHAGGLDDFPGATVHLLRQERDYAVEQRTWLDRQRFRPQQWATRQNWEVYDPEAGEAWFGFDSIRALRGLPPEILMIPLPGHTFGHAGIAVRSGAWLLHAGDAYFHHREMDIKNPGCTPGLRFYQWMMEKDREARLGNQARLRDLLQAFPGKVNICCSHDPIEFERFAGRPLQDPSPAMR